MVFLLLLLCGDQALSPSSHWVCVIILITIRSKNSIHFLRQSRQYYVCAQRTHLCKLESRNKFFKTSHLRPATCFYSPLVHIIILILFIVIIVPQSSRLHSHVIFSLITN